MNCVIINAHGCPESLWKNGGGVTRELLKTEGFRLSLADITQDGAFSSFPNVVRHFAVIEGEGVELSFKSIKITMDCLSPPLEFKGEDAPFCRLLNGTTRDLNLMVYKGKGSLSHESGLARGFFSFESLCLHWFEATQPLLFKENGLYISYEEA